MWEWPDGKKILQENVKAKNRALRVVRIPSAYEAI